MLSITDKKAKPSGETRIIASIANSLGERVATLSLNQNSRNGEELIELPNTLKFTIMPETRHNLVNTIFVSGQAGSGKSYFSASYLRNFIKVFKPDAEDIIIISADDVEDPAYVGIPHRHIIIDDSLILNPISLDELTGKKGRSVVIFDDIEGKTGKLEKAVNSLTESVLTMGRKRGINTIFISHRSASGKLTKNILNEQNMIVWFPQTGTSRNLTYMLTQHIGLPEGMREALKGAGWGRWIALYTNAPQCLVGEARTAIFDADECDKALKTKSILEKKKIQKQALIKIEQMAEED